MLCTLSNDMKNVSRSTRVVSVARSIETGNPRDKAEHNIKYGIYLQVYSACKRSESPQEFDQIARSTTLCARLLLRVLFDKLIYYDLAQKLKNTNNDSMIK